jgi:hypothetical protein
VVGLDLKDGDVALRITEFLSGVVIVERVRAVRVIDEQQIRQQFKRGVRVIVESNLPGRLDILRRKRIGVTRLILRRLISRVIRRDGRRRIGDSSRRGRKRDGSFCVIGGTEQRLLCL